MDTWPPSDWPPKLYQFDALGRRVAVAPPGTGQTPPDDARQVAGPPVPDIGSTPDSAVAPAEQEAPLVDGFPASPAVARRRYGPAYATSHSPDAGAP
jgi:hypothetical protein